MCILSLHAYHDNELAFVKIELDAGADIWTYSEWDVDSYSIAVITEYYIASLVSVVINTLADLRSEDFTLFTVLVCQTIVIMTLASAHEVNVIGTCTLYWAYAKECSFVGYSALCIYINLFYLDGFRAAWLQVDKCELALA